MSSPKADGKVRRSGSPQRKPLVGFVCRAPFKGFGHWKHVTYSTKPNAERLFFWVMFMWINIRPPSPSMNSNFGLGLQEGCSAQEQQKKREKQHGKNSTQTLKGELAGASMQKESFSTKGGYPQRGCSIIPLVFGVDAILVRTQGRSVCCRHPRLWEITTAIQQKGPPKD